MRLVLITLGDPARLTGGYLYHRRLAELAPAQGARIEFVSFPERPFPLALLDAPAVLERAMRRRPRALLLDSLAAAYLGLALAWQGPPVPMLGILHQPPGGIGQGRLRTALQAFLDRLAYRRSARLLVASQWLADVLARGYPAGKVLVAAPGRDVATELEPAGELRGGRAAALLCVANWLPMKDLHSLLEAFAALPPEAATLHLVGDTEADRAYQRRLRARLDRPDLVGRVVVHGKLSRARVAGMYAASDVFVLPSLWETYGTVYGEAMAAGLPVVGWRLGNLPFLARHEQEGLILEPGDVPGLTRSLQRLAGDEPLRRRMGQAAAERARTFPTWEETTRTILQAAREVAG